jgi:probable HAF family extracellular repeat protein
MKRLICLALLLCLAVSVQAEVQYTITDLGTLGGSYSEAHGINDSGQVVGYSSIGNHYHAFLYNGTTMNDLGTLGGTSSRAFAINNSGQVTGYGYTDESLHHAFLYDGTTMNDLGTIGSRYHSYAYGINDSGQVAGYGDTDVSSAHAFFYDGTTMNDLGTLGGPRSHAHGINDSGQVVGESYTAQWDAHAFLYDGTTMNDLGTLGGNASEAFAINDIDQVVGWSSNGSDWRAFLYDETEGMLDLNNLIPSDSGWALWEARDINSSGQIVGYGYIDEKKHAYLLTPVPEPATIFLITIGGVLLRRKSALYNK